MNERVLLDMEIAWNINQWNQLDCGYFPIIDGPITSIAYDRKSGVLEVRVDREDLGEECVILARDVERCAIEIWGGGDIVASVKIEKIGLFSDDGRWPGVSDRPWSVLYRHYGERSIDSIFRRDKTTYADHYILHIQGNMDGSIIAIFRSLELTLNTLDVANSTVSKP